MIGSRQESDGEAEPGCEVTYEHISRMPYLDAVMKETLRLFPIAARTSRECTDPVDINGMHFAKGDMVGVPIYAIHHDPHYYPEPERFHPERFYDDDKEQENAVNDAMAYLPFGYGPRNCIGRRFAEFEIRIAMTHLLRRYRLCRVENSPVRCHFAPDMRER